MNSTFNITTPTGAPIAPLYPQAIIFPIVSFPAWILCIPSMAWHFSQRNVAAGSLILWMLLNNFFNSINSLIWPRDNLMDWWDGSVWCDINVRIQIGSSVGLAASTAMIVRKLAKVMDTRNITVSSSRNSKIKECVLEVLWCWVYPLIMIIIYYVVQPIRYMLYGIVGCISAYDTSWPSMVLNFMWMPITMLVAAYYAGLLVYRLYRYRREFSRLVAVRNTTKSRFMRLFIICVIIILIYLPYSIWMIVGLSSEVKDPYSWDTIHGSNFNTIMKIPVSGQVSLEKWVQAATGYVIFFVFGTGTDSHNLYKKMLLVFGLGKIFPSLYNMRESGGSTPRSFIAARTWGSTLSAKAKSMFFSKTDSKTNATRGTFNSSMRNNSVALDSIPNLYPVTTEDTLLKQKQQDARQASSSTAPSFLKRFFRLDNFRDPVLPLFTRRSATKSTNSNQSVTPSVSSGVHAHAWASDSPVSRQASETEGVHVVREVRQDHRERDEIEKEKRSADRWA